MAKLRVTGKRFSINGMLGVTLIAIAIVAVASLIVAAVVLPTVAGVSKHETPDVVAIVPPENGLISIGADPSQVFVTVKYSDGSSNQVALSELVVTGLDTSTEGTVDGVVLDYGGFKQTVSFNVVPTELKVEYVASTGGRIDGETEQSITAGANATRVEAIPDEGYYFAHWSDGDINSSRLDTQVSKSMRLIAVFEKLRYTVVFYYPDGTTAREEIVAYNESPMRVPRPDEHNMELYGYRFVGWDTDFTHITKDTNIYPIFEKYSADFHIEYTTDRSGRPLGTSNALNYYENDELATVRVTANADRKFIGWSVYNVDLQAWIDLEPVMDGGKLISVGVNYALEFVSTRTGTTEEFVLSFTPDENVSDIYVKAHFVYLESEISFTSMNNKAHESFLIAYDTPIGEKFDVEDLSYLETLGYAFKGWYAKGGEVKEDGTPVFVNNQTTFSQPTELVAYWEKEIYKAVFLKGDNESASFVDPALGYDEEAGGRVVTAYYQDSLAGALSGAFPDETPIKENYTFVGWYLADADKLPTSTVVDRTFKVESPVVYIVPVFKVNTKTLTVSIEGSGAIYTLIHDSQYGVDNEVSISGKVQMPVTETYRIRIRPSVGYALTKVNVNGATNVGDDLTGVDGYYDVIIESIIQTDYNVYATFNLTKYEVAIANGTEVTSQGHLVYNVLGNDETSKQASDAINTVVQVNYGSGLSVEINPDEGYYIASVSLNGQALAVPSEAVYYNLIIENVTANNTVVINYREFSYFVTLPAASEYGEMIADVNASEYVSGNSPSFTVNANEGYYIRRITANGTIIDPYISASGYIINSIKVNDKAPEAGVIDYRVTSVNLMIDGIKRNVEFEVEFAKLYYNVTVSYEGIGSATAPFTAYYGKAFHVNGFTSSGYYVHSVIVNGIERTYDDVQLAREYSVSSVKEDYDIRFVFKRTIYFVRFIDSDGTSSVTYNGQTVNLASGEGYTFNGIEHSTTAEFAVKAKDGYYINKVHVTSNAGAEYYEIINYSEKAHVLTLSNVSASYTVEIECVPIGLEYAIYFINKGDNEVEINNNEITASVFNATIAYGNAITVNITAADGYVVDLDNIVIKNKDAREKYYYEQLRGEYNQVPTNGFYSLIAESGSSATALYVYDVHTSIDIYIYFEKSNSGNNVLGYDSEGNGNLIVTDNSGNVIESGSALASGSSVLFTIDSDAGYVLEAFIVNGELVEVDDNSYTLTVNGDNYVYAIFSETEYTITVSSGVENGVIATEKNMVEADTSFNIKLTPVEGYYVYSFEISVEGSDVVYQPLNGSEFGNYVSGLLEYEFPAQNVTGNITISASFAPIQYELKYSHSANGTLGGVGESGSVDVFYGETKEIELSASNGYYISKIVLNGDSISPQTLIGTPIVTGEYTLGILQVYVSGNTTLEVEFSPMVYTITVNETLGGETLVRKGNSAYVTASELKLGADDIVSIKMSAGQGYHIEELRVNGVVDTNWLQVENVSKNDLTEIYYNLGAVSGNITLRVIYAVNEYQIKVNVSNQSPNFSEVDVDNNTYGTVTVMGYTPGENNLYTGFTHGSNVKFVVTPRTARGYYIARFEIQYFDEDGSLISNVVNTLNENGGSYILYGISHDIQAVNVEFRRRMFTYEGFKTIENLGSGWASTGDVIANFTNPYLSQPVVLENGMYEYGLNYTITVNPGEGYSRTLFTVNGEDRLKSVRNHNYVGTVTGNLSVQVVYTIDTFEVSAEASLGGSYYIYDINDTLLWAPGIEIISEGDSVSGGTADWTYSERSTATGTVWATADGLTVTYGTEVIFSATPHNESNGFNDEGYRISGFYINGQARIVQNEDAVMRVNYVVKSHVSCEISFTVHTYRVEVNSFEGGVATLSTSIVEWNSNVTIRLVINRGYVMVGVKINGDEKSDIARALDENGTYTLSHVTAHSNIVITLANKEYDITFTGDYNVAHDIMQNGVKVKEVNAVSGIIINQNSALKVERAHYTSDSPLSFDINGKLINRAVYADKLTIMLTAPVGYRITAVSITMDNDGGVVSNLVLGENGLDADDGSGTRTYTIPSMTGNVIINIEYAIKTYTVEYVQRSGGKYVSTGVTLVSHHELFTVDMISDNGYYLANLDINGRSIPTVNSKDGMRYSYTTDTKSSSGADTSLEINDILVNGGTTITVIPTYEKQRYSVIFYINNLQITNLYQDETLGVYLENSEIIYDASNPTVITHTLREGCSISAVYFINRPSNTNHETYNFRKVGSAERNYNLFAPKGETLEVILDEGILGMMDFHSTSQNVIRIYYTTERDNHVSASSMYLVQSRTEGSVLVNYGATVEASAVPSIGSRKAFTLTPSFSDSISSDTHIYGTEATLTVNIPAAAANSYSFQGFQEYVNGEWNYVVSGVNGITLQSGGQVLRYTMTSDRVFRAVFFRTYQITVQIHPEYKYYEGSFATSDPNRMRYRQYANLTATATYSQNANRGVILPNVNGLQETLVDTDGADDDATYTYRVLSGAKLVLQGNDSVSVNSTRGYSYSVVTYNGEKLTQREDAYTSGVEALEDRLIYAYFNNVMYVSFAMETVGSQMSSEGGTVSYAVNGATVGNLSNNSLTMSPNQTLTITITPKANYRFDSIMELLPLSKPDAQGFRQFSSNYTPLRAQADGSVEITYYEASGVPITGNIDDYSGRIGRVVVTLNNLKENSIFKIRFWKQVEVKSRISIVTDESEVGGPLPEYDISYGNAPEDGIYDYNATLSYNLSFSILDTVFRGYLRYYQFVGYFINGINAYTQLIQNYPSTYQGEFILNNLDGLSNGVNIAETTTIVSGIQTTTYTVEIVARFIPVYNVVVENEYLDNGNYLDPGQITATTIMYDEDLTQYFSSSVNVEPKLGADISYNTDISFQMLGKINTIDNTNKNSSSSPYNTWKDNEITLNWAGTSGSGDNFAFIAWQYYAYDRETDSFGWRNIPYVDPNSQTNLVTKPRFTFPISSLFSTTYPAFVNYAGNVDSRFDYSASQYGYDGGYVSSETIHAVRIRPLFQKVESLELVKSTALNEENIFLDGRGDVEPKINGTSRSSGNFNYYTVQTLLPAAVSGYEFAGWYITENGQGGYQQLTATVDENNYDKKVVQDSITYYLKTEEILNTSGQPTGDYITYAYNSANQQIDLLMDGSFKIFARYIRIYTISVRVSNVSGFSQVLTDAMPTLNYYKMVNGEWVLQEALSGDRMINIRDARVGSRIMFTLSTNYTGNVNDSTYFNPLYDRFAGITSVNENNLNLWDENGSLDYQYSSIPEVLKEGLDGRDSATLREYNDAVKAMRIIITANAEKTVNVNFESYGTLVLHNVYVGSSIKLPNELGNILFGGDADEAHYVKDEDNDGIITINNIPIAASRSFDGQESGDYANRLIDTANVLASDNISIGVNFDGLSIEKKVQHIVYYSQAEWDEYVWEGGVLKAVRNSATSLYDYPFADGGISGASGAGDGSKAKPFKVATVDHLRNIDNLYKGNDGTFVYGQSGNDVLRVHFKQVADINLNETNNALTSPLCSAFTSSDGVTHSNGFNGVYDGGGYSLYNLQFELNSTNITENVGIFAQVFIGGQIKNLKLGRASITARANNVGILAGQVFGGLISSVNYEEKGANSISNNIIGNDFVGGLVGLLAGESEYQGIIENSSMAYMTVSARIGGEYLGVGFDFTGGVGGLVGSIGAFGSVRGGNGTYTVKEVTVQTGSTSGSGVGAGGVVGTVQAMVREHKAIDSVTAIDARLASESNSVAIGGVVGAVSFNRTVSNVSYKIVGGDATISSYSAPSGFTTPTSTVDGNYKNYGGGGIAGFNNGTISGASVTTDGIYRLIVNGSMVGGLVGVNFGIVESSNVRARLFSSRQKADAYEGGTYGGMIGYNIGTISGGGITGAQTATNDYNSATAAYEIVTAGREAYIPTANGNGGMHGDAGSDTAYIYVGGVVGYNEGIIDGVANNGKIMVNRRSNDELSNYSYIGAISGYSKNTSISGATGTAIIKFFHYLWVDQANDVSQEMWAYIGNSRGNGTNEGSSCSVTATVEYIGGGTIFNSASIEAGFKWGYEGSGYLSGSASVNFYGVSGTASSYAPDWNVSGTIESSSKDSGKVYAGECIEHGGDISTLWKSTWNYNGYLRYVAITTTSA